MTDFAARRTMMVDTQVRVADVTKFPIIDAMLRVHREAFVPASMREAAYVGENLIVAPGRAILEPRTLAKMLESLNVGPRDLVLDLGCATGYSAAVLSMLGQAVVAVEPDEAMAREAEAALSEAGIDNVVVEVASLTDGAPRHGPYDVVMLQGAVETIPQAIVGQLADGGRIGCLFMEGALGVARLGLKTDGVVSWRYAFNASAPVLPGFAREAEFQL